jgi:hypothetical protein
MRGVVAGVNDRSGNARHDRDRVGGRHDGGVTD